jgi:hypothetical protein
VCLWLGANVMLEYPRDEAILLLEDNLKNAKAALVTLIDDMGHLRDQITVTEVNMARVFNWDVKVRRARARRPTPSRTPRAPRTLEGGRRGSRRHRVLGAGRRWGAGAGGLRPADRECLWGACPGAAVRLRAVGRGCHGARRAGRRSEASRVSMRLQRVAGQRAATQGIVAGQALGSILSPAPRPVLGVCRSDAMRRRRLPRARRSRADLCRAHG